MFVGAILESLNVMNVSLMLGQKSLAGSVVGSPGTIAKMLDFSARHNVKPIIEKFRFEDVNDAIARLRSGEARYRIVLYR